MKDLTSTAGDDTATIRKAEVMIGLLLRYGVILATSVSACGILLSLLQAKDGPSTPLAAAIAAAETGQLQPATSVWPEFSLAAVTVFWQHPELIVLVGILLLIALPIVRVAATMVVFALQKDIVYTMISLIVLTTLVLGLWLGAEL